tara:strand:- start:4096 stop:4407 length:312 start_codon:yes stop_codon:yes gene_type:complete
MSIENENPMLKEQVSPDNPLKEMIVGYVGEKETPSNGEVTVNMIVDTMAQEFPEFLTVIAEENWVLGYRQALTDAETGQKAYEELLAQQDAQSSDEEQSTTDS